MQLFSMTDIPLNLCPSHVQHNRCTPGANILTAFSNIHYGKVIKFGKITEKFFFLNFLFLFGYLLCIAATINFSKIDTLEIAWAYLCISKSRKSKMWNCQVSIFLVLFTLSFWFHNLCEEKKNNPYNCTSCFFSTLDLKSKYITHTKNV